MNQAFLFFFLTKNCKIVWFVLDYFAKLAKFQYCKYLKTKNYTCKKNYSCKGYFQTGSPFTIVANLFFPC